MIPKINTGLIWQPLPNAFVQGVLPYKVVLPSGDWRPFTPVGERQDTPLGDTLACVSFSNSNCAEIALKQQGIDVNFSDRFLAKMSGTTKLGNRFDIVENANKTFGRVLESQWPMVTPFSWDSYYAPIPPEVQKLAVFYDEQYEFIATDKQTLAYYLKQSPLEIAIPTPVPNHGVVLVHLDGDTAYYFDSYPGSGNYLETIPVTMIEGAMRLIIKPLTMIKRFIIQDGIKLGVMVLEGFTGTIAFADNPPHLQSLKDAFGFTGSEVTIQIPQ